MVRAYSNIVRYVYISDGLQKLQNVDAKCRSGRQHFPTTCSIVICPVVVRTRVSVRRRGFSLHVYIVLGSPIYAFDSDGVLYCLPGTELRRQRARGNSFRPLPVAPSEPAAAPSVYVLHWMCLALPAPGVLLCSTSPAAPQMGSCQSGVLL